MHLFSSNYPTYYKAVCRAQEGFFEAAVPWIGLLSQYLQEMEAEKLPLYMVTFSRRKPLMMIFCDTVSLMLN